MRTNIFEKEVLYAFGCPNRTATVARLRRLAALAPNIATRKLFFVLALKLSVENAETWYSVFFQELRTEMKGYHDAKRTIKLVEERAYGMEDDDGKSVLGGTL
jgi:hypothetical protein